MATAVIVGSAFGQNRMGEKELDLVQVATPEGNVPVYRYPFAGRDAFVLFRHGLPHSYLPHQIPYRAHAWALRELGVRTLLVTSSVGVMSEHLPLFQPLLVADLIMPENRFPDGTSCTMFTAARKGQGHLVIEEGLFSTGLSDQIRRMTGSAEIPNVTFAYVPGPRTKRRK